MFPTSSSFRRPDFLGTLPRLHEDVLDDFAARQRELRMLGNLVENGPDLRIFGVNVKVFAVLTFRLRTTVFPVSGTNRAKETSAASGSSRLSTCGP